MYARMWMCEYTCVPKYANVWKCVLGEKKYKPIISMIIGVRILIIKEEEVIGERKEL